MEEDKIDLKELLLHWWHYYGKLMYTLKELEDFEAIIDKKGAEKVFEAVVGSFLYGDGSNTILLLSIRKNQVDELFKSLPNIEEFSDDKVMEYNKVKEFLLAQIEKTYLHGED